MQDKLQDDPKVYLDMYAGDKIFTKKNGDNAKFDDSYWSFFGKPYKLQSWLPFFSSC